MRQANEAAINRVLLEDAASFPAEFTTPPPQSATAGASQTRAALVAVREGASSQSSHGAGGNGSRSGQSSNATTFGVGNIPMTGRIAAPQINGNYPSMDDRSVVFHGRDPVPPMQLTVPARTIAPQPVPAPAAQPVPSIISPTPAAMANIMTPQSATMSLPPLVESSQPMTIPNPQFFNWYQQPLSQPPHNIHTQRFSGPYIAPVTTGARHVATQPLQHINVANSLPASGPLAFPQPPTIGANNLGSDPFGIVGGSRPASVGQRAAATNDFSNLFGDPSHPQNSNRGFPFAPTIWTTPIFPNPAIPAPPAIPPPIINAPVSPPVTPPRPQNNAAPPAPPVSSVTSFPENARPPPPIVPLQQEAPPPLPPIPQPVIPPAPLPSLDVQAPRVANSSTTPSQVAPNSLPTIIPLKGPTTTTITTATPNTGQDNTGHASISFSDRQPHAIAPKPIVLVANTSMEGLKEFKPAFIPMIGIAAIFAYAFMGPAMMVIFGCLIWYSYRFQQIQEAEKRKRKS